MPGHVKLGAGGGEDPDPTPYLVVSMDMKREAMSKPYDSKKSHWCPDGSGGFQECLVENDDGKKATVMVGHEVSSLLVLQTLQTEEIFCLEKNLQI